MLLAKGNYVFPISTPYLGIHERLLLKKTLECKRKLVYLVVWPIEISIFYIYQHISMFEINVLPILSQNMFSLTTSFVTCIKNVVNHFAMLKCNKTLTSLISLTVICTINVFFPFKLLSSPVCSH